MINFNWNQTASAVYGNDTISRQTGYLAQNVESIFPELVVTNKEGYKEVNYSALGLYAVEGVKELSLHDASTTAMLHTITSAINIKDASSSVPSISIDTSGNVGIGTTSPLAVLHVFSNATGTVARFENKDGYCEINPSEHSLSCTSDDGFRTDVHLIDSTSTASSSDILATTASTTLEKLSALHVVSYVLSSDVASSTHTGLVMDEIKTLFPDLVKVDTDGVATLSYTNFIPYIIESIKTLTTKIQLLANAITDIGNSLTTHTVHSDTVCVKRTDGTESCINGDQLDKILQSGLFGVSSASASTNTPSPTDTSSTTTSTSISTSTPDTTSRTTEVLPPPTDTTSVATDTTTPVDTTSVITDSSTSIQPTDTSTTTP